MSVVRAPGESRLLIEMTADLKTGSRLCSFAPGPEKSDGVKS